MIFVWTFHGAMEAIALGVVLLGFAVIGLLVAWVKLLKWWEHRKKKPNNVLTVSGGREKTNAK